MNNILSLSRCISLGYLLLALCVAVKIRYISTEHPAVTYYNTKYISYANLTSQRYGRKDPYYYVGFHFYSLYPFDNNITAHFYFCDLVSFNTYRRSFLEMHWNMCDLVHKDKFFGTALKQSMFTQPCPFPAGACNLYNMTIPVTQIARSFPFTKGRIYCNATATKTEELIASMYIDMEIKEVDFKRKKN